MKVRKVTLMIIDFDELSDSDIKDVIEETRYPNRCISPKVIDIQSKDIGEWDDNNALNYLNTRKDEFVKLFGGEQS